MGTEGGGKSKCGGVVVRDLTKMSEEERGRGGRGGEGGDDWGGRRRESGHEGCIEGRERRRKKRG